MIDVKRKPPASDPVECVIAGTPGDCTVKVGQGPAFGWPTEAAAEIGIMITDSVKTLNSRVVKLNPAEAMILGRMLIELSQQAVSFRGRP